MSVERNFALFFAKGLAEGCLLLFSVQALALFPGDSRRDNYRDLTFLGRGGAGLAVATGGAAGFYNPAGLADSKTVSFQPLDLTLGTNKNVISSITQISTLTSGNQTLSEKFSPFLGKPLGLQGSFYPHFSTPGFLIGFFDYGDANIEYKDPVYPRLGINARNDNGLIIGAATGYKEMFQVGASIRYTRRKVIDEEISMASAFTADAAYLKALVRHGESYGLNVGIRSKQKLNANMWVASGLVIEDAGFTTFKNSDRSLLPGRQVQKINLGFAYGADLAGSNIQVMLDLKDLKDTEQSFSKKIFTGAELSIPLASFRAGLYQGYWTLGASFAVLPFLDIELVSYGEELYSAAGLREARFYMIGFKSGVDLQEKQKAKKKQRAILDQVQ